jgi:hypothetical protein
MTARARKRAWRSVVEGLESCGIPSRAEPVAIVFDDLGAPAAGTVSRAWRRRRAARSRSEPFRSSPADRIPSASHPVSSRRSAAGGIRGPLPRRTARPAPAVVAPPAPRGIGPASTDNSQIKKSIVEKKLTLFPHICQKFPNSNGLRQTGFSGSDAQISTDISITTRTRAGEFGRDVRKRRTTVFPDSPCEAIYYRELEGRSRWATLEGRSRWATRHRLWRPRRADPRVVGVFSRTLHPNPLAVGQTLSKRRCHNDPDQWILRA